MKKARVVFSDATHCQCVFDNLFVLYTAGGATTANIDRFTKQFDGFAMRARGSVACIIVTAANTSPPNEADRAKVVHLMERHSDKLKALAIVLRSTGFRGSIIRSVAAGLFLIPNHGYPTKIFPGSQAASPWVADRLGWPVYEVEGAIQFAIGRFESRSSQHV